ncbi:hypothetical protein H4R35_003479 [Dimargaris xerosporica]|nr:hypothetical protein H4R35_003479 [Dimargaris xerosporica]
MLPLLRPTAARRAPLLKSRWFHAAPALWKGQVLTADHLSFTQLVEEHKGRVLVDFTAEWCGPCRMLKPLLKEAIESQDKIDMVVLDIDNAGEVAQKYGITSVPTIKVFDHGKEIDGFVGHKTAAFIKQFINKHTSQGE